MQKATNAASYAENMMFDLGFNKPQAFFSKTYHMAVSGEGYLV